MLKQFFAYMQYLLPQHLLSRIAGYLAESHQPWIKNIFIKSFAKIYKIDLSEAVVTDPAKYDSFNDFFIRQLKPNRRPMASDNNIIVSPVDGTISQIGNLNKTRLLQAKHFNFDLHSLLGGDEKLTQDFTDGVFGTFYLAPNNYHRVHMPLSGRLLKTIYVPGKLFSVNHTTSHYIPNLYAHNERYISLFETSAGQMIVILVGAMIVGSIQTVWLKQPIRQQKIRHETFSASLLLEKGAELGYFKMGSTVIILFQKNKMSWSNTLSTGSAVQYGQAIGRISRVD